MAKREIGERPQLRTPLCTDDLFETHQILLLLIRDGLRVVVVGGGGVGVEEDDVQNGSAVDPQSSSSAHSSRFGDEDLGRVAQRPTRQTGRVNLADGGRQLDDEGPDR